MPSPRGADPEYNMRESLMLFIKENRAKVTTIAALFLKNKKPSLNEYIKFMSTPGYWGDELVVHLLAIMSQIHYCIIMPRNLLIHRMPRKNKNPLPIQRKRVRKSESSAFKGIQSGQPKKSSASVAHVIRSAKKSK